jgi:hypothetical protein
MYKRLVPLESPDLRLHTHIIFIESVVLRFSAGEWFYPGIQTLHLNIYSNTIDIQKRFTPLDSPKLGLQVYIISLEITILT